jgi:hypothetical protein
MRGPDNHVPPVVVASRSAVHVTRATLADENGGVDSAPVRRTLFVIPTTRGDGFRASIRGHRLELAEPTDRASAPTPDDLLIASISSDLAWAARRFLRDHALADDVSVSAAWWTFENSWRPNDGRVTVAVAGASEATRNALAATLEERLVGRALDNHLRVSVRARL